MRKVLAFSHIPKNAGSLVTHLLRSYYGINHCRAFSRDQIYRYNDLRQDLAIFPSLKAISGHSLRPFVDFREYEESMVWAILIRDPYSRFPSQYKWWCKKNDSSISFEDWCELKGEKFSDFQCKWICGSADYGMALRVLDSKKVIVGFQSDIMGFMGKIANAFDIHDFPWDESLVINAGSKGSSNYPTSLIEKYNAQDILLYQELRSREKAASNRSRDWTRPPNFVDKLNYGLNLLKHVLLYKPYKKFS